MYKWLRNLLLILLPVLLVLSGGCSLNTAITVGISPDDKPLSFKGTDGSPDGYIVEFAREAGRIMGRKIEFKYIDMSKKSKNFTDENVDVLWGEIENTDNDRKSMLFTKPYLKDRQVVIVESSSIFENRKDLDGKTIGAVKDSRAEKDLAKSLLIKNAKGAADVKYKNLDSAFKALDKSKINAIAVSYSYACNAISEHAQQYRIIGGALSNQQYRVAVRRNDKKLRDMIETSIEKMQSGGTGKSISNKWFGTDLT